MSIHYVGVPFFLSPIWVLLFLDEIQAMDQISSCSLWNILSPFIHLPSSQCHGDEMNEEKDFSEESLYFYSTNAFPKWEKIKIHFI